MGKVTDAKVLEREKKLSKEEKLELINKEIEEFLEYCEKSGYSEADIDAACKPLWEGAQSERRKRVARNGLLLTLFITITVLLLNVNPSARLLAALGRQMTMKILPYWDWTQLYYEECLWANPYYEDVKLTTDDCKSCEDFKHIEHVSNVSHGLMTYEYLYSNIPVIVTDATSDWLATESFTSIEKLHQIHLDNDRLREGLPCELISNVNLRSSDNLLLMSRAVQGEYNKFYAIWQQCDFPPSKAMRAFFRRPYFFPPMVEMVRSNWLIISRDYHGDKYKAVPLESQVVYIAQILGESRVQLVPNAPCNDSCHTVTGTLRQGHTLVYTSGMWNASWLPRHTDTGGGTDTIAIATGGYFD